jgi:hypothetical protein
VTTPAPATPAATGTPPPPASVLLAEVRQAVAEIRGLEPSDDVDPVVIDEATLRANLEAEFDAAYPAAEVEETEGFLITLGLLPPGTSLRQLNLDLQGGQVVGYYSPDKDELYIVSRSGGVGALELATYAHEFTHQLQDQQFDLDALGLDDPDASDQALARLALVEGDATITQSTWMQNALSPEQMGEIFAAGLDPAALEVLRRTPAVLRELALFPYREGLAFATALFTGGGYGAIDAAYASPPESTEQVLHPEKYFDRELPLQVDLPDNLADSLGAGWSEHGQDTFGEQFLRIWLREGGLSAAEARAGADGWGGDRASLLRGPGDQRAIALVTDWDDPFEADEFAELAEDAIASLGLTARLVQQASSTRVAIAIGDEAALLSAALGD